MLPTQTNRRRVSQWRKVVVSFRRARVTLPAPSVLCIVLLLLVNESSRSYKRSITDDKINWQGNGISSCRKAEVQPLSSFDSYVEEQKAVGSIQAEFENRFQEIVWDTIQLSGNGYHRVYPADSDKAWSVREYGRGLDRDLLAFEEQAKQTVQGGKLVYVHARIDRLRGLQFAGAVRTFNGDISLISVQQGLGKPCVVRKKSVGAQAQVYIVLPYSKRAERLRLLLENVRVLREQYHANIVVIVCVLRGASDDEAEVRRSREAVFGVSNWENVVNISENGGDVNGDFSRGVALRDAVQHHVMDDNAVVFLCDVDLVLTPSFVERCAANSIRRRQVYYPVFYSLFPYGNKLPAVKQFNGFWRVTSFGMVCLRKGDFEDVNAFGDAEIRFRGWGSEDVYMFQKIRNSTNLVALRAIEPGLVHRWHAKHCDRESKDYWNCMKTNFVTMGHPLIIGPAVVNAFKSDQDFYNIAQNIV